MTKQEWETIESVRATCHGLAAACSMQLAGHGELNVHELGERLQEANIKLSTLLQTYPYNTQHLIKISNPSVSKETKRLFMAEIDNEAEGGESPSTLASALDSVNQGYNPDLEGKMDMNKVANEIKDLIHRWGWETELEYFLTNKDWADRCLKQKNGI